MKERPILFSAPMVRAILEGRKTQTRRVIKLREFQRTETPGYDFIFRDKRALWNDYRVADLIASKHNRYGKPGDLLWVRESIWARNESCDHEYCGGCDAGSLLDLGEDYADVQYVATPECCDPPELVGAETIVPCDGNHAHGSWWRSPPPGWNGEDYERGTGQWVFCPTTYSTKHPSIHMPRWASRITLEVTGVRIERAQDISREDAIAEGAKRFDDIPPSKLFPSGEQSRWSMEQPEDCGQCLGSPQTAFGNLWIKINGQESWDANPWVWVIEFKRIEAQERAA